MLADALHLLDSDQSLRPCDFLQQAQDALTYLSGPGREVQIAARGVASRATDQLHGHHPEWFEAMGARGRARCQDDLEYHLSYLADALALDRADVFVEYVRWVGTFLARHSVPADHLLATLAVIDAALELSSPAVLTAAHELLDQASRALVATAS